MAEDSSLRERLWVHHRDSAEDGVKRDIHAARRKVKSDGLLVFNDYTIWSYEEMEPYGVVAAVNELCIDDHWKLVYLALPCHMYCDVAVRRMSGTSLE